ncbi:MAG TPA: L,D-transpeptidase [Trebonia sp.]|jgi:lipoprotein-anchoring transpeptidase ErfK/SrfK|nr:L,D-transpeptidase [Trebonia sp.]
MGGATRHGHGKHARSRRRTRGRATLVVLSGLGSAVVLIGAAIGVAEAGSSALASGSAAHPDDGSPTAAGSAPGRLALMAHSAGQALGTVAASTVAAGTTGASGDAPGQPTLTPAQRLACPVTAVACVDLTAHVTWLQTDGKVTFGPVRMEPGRPGTANATPAGKFRVQWKAGPGFVSDEYDEAMPWATFFAPGGIAFHGGSLTKWSHGCVHLTTPNAEYYHDHLPIGAEVVVF